MLLLSVVGTKRQDSISAHFLDLVLDLHPVFFFLVLFNDFSLNSRSVSVHIRFHILLLY